MLRTDTIQITPEILVLDVFTEMDGGAISVAIDETKLPFRRQVNRLLRERVGCDAPIKFETPTSWRD